MLAELDSAELVSKFESLGNDCEFGEVQRRLGAEPLSLFRWSNPLPEAILRALRCDFADLGEKAYVALDAQTPAEWIVYEPTYDLKQHTHVRVGQLEERVVKEQQMLRFHFLKRKFLEDLAEANKIYVIKAYPNLECAAVQPIAQELRRRAENWLLWVVGGDEVGKVELIEPGLIRGTVAYLRAQGECFGDFAYDSWEKVLRAAWAMIRHEKDRAGRGGLKQS